MVLKVTYQRVPDPGMEASLSEFILENVGRNRSVKGKNRVVFCLHPIELLYRKSLICANQGLVHIYLCH